MVVELMIVFSQRDHGNLLRSLYISSAAHWQSHGLIRADGSALWK